MISNRHGGQILGLLLKIRTSTVLYCTVQYSTVQCCTVLHFVVPGMLVWTIQIALYVAQMIQKENIELFISYMVFGEAQQANKIIRNITTWYTITIMQSILIMETLCCTCNKILCTSAESDWLYGLCALIKRIVQNNKVYQIPKRERICMQYEMANILVHLQVHWTQCHSQRAFWNRLLVFLIPRTCMWPGPFCTM